MKNLFEGTISCKAVLEAKKRIINHVYVDEKKRSRDFRYIVHLAKEASIPVTYCSRALIDSMAQGKTHGGMILECETRRWLSLNQTTDGWMAYIDGVEDPYNLGSICRTLYASGCQALILPKRDWSKSESIVLKASAGAYEKMDIYQIEQEADLVDWLRCHQIPLYCAHRKEAKGLYEMQFADRFCLALGGALRGLSATITQASTQNIVIEYGRDFRNALDSASATAVFSFEILRQRKERENNVEI